MSRIFSGIQPSGELHIGNYLGAVKNWVGLQRQFDTIICVVDYHAITARYEPEQLRERRHAMAVSLLAAGIDPSVCSLFVQSQVPEHTELAWIFNTITPLGELERQTQFKEKSQRQESVNAGVLTYPVLQAADILLYRADKVPVGEDQVQHLELSRVVARRWNAAFGLRTGRQTEDGAEEREAFFPEPEPLLTPTRRIMGLDGQVEDVEVDGQHDRADGDAGSDLGEAASGGHRPQADSQDGSRHARGLQHLSPAQGIQSAGDGPARRNAVQHGRLGMHRLQESLGGIDGA